MNLHARTLYGAMTITRPKPSSRRWQALDKLRIDERKAVNYVYKNGGG